MARETKLLFSLSDIRAVRFTCGAEGCGAVQSFAVKSWNLMPRGCSNDQSHNWIQPESPDAKIISQFRDALQALIKHNGTRAFRLQLEFDAPRDEDHILFSGPAFESK